MKNANIEKWFIMVPSSEATEKLPRFDFFEKAALRCRYCNSQELSSPEVRSHVLFGVVDEKPAECVLFRNHYKCIECGKSFFQSASNRDLEQETFTEEFIKQALERWTAIKDKTLRGIGEEYFISMPTIEKWEKSLVDFFDSHFHAETNSSLVFSSFLDRNRIRRGIVYAFDNDGNSFISAFLREYTVASIERYIDCLDEENKNKVRHIIFRYIPDLCDILQRKFLLAETICISIDNLYTVLCNELQDYWKDDEITERNRLKSLLYANRKTFEDRRTNKKEILIWLSDTEKVTGSELNTYRRLFTEEFHLLTDNKKFPDIPIAITNYPKVIRALANKKMSYDAIALKMYDTEDVKNQISEAIHVAAQQHGVDTRDIWHEFFNSGVKNVTDNVRTLSDDEIPFFVPEIRGISIKIL